MRELLEGWNGAYDGLPEEAKMLLRIGFEVGWEEGQKQTRKAMGLAPFSDREIDLFGAVLRKHAEIEVKV